MTKTCSTMTNLFRLHRLKPTSKALERELDRAWFAYLVCELRLHLSGGLTPTTWDAWRLTPLGTKMGFDRKKMYRLLHSAGFRFDLNSGTWKQQ